LLPTLTDVGTIKVLCDAYFLDAFRAEAKKRRHGGAPRDAR